ncbi:MAG: peptidoglycan-binding protein, partial [Candidatus Pacebacteria bacterium]|nr:peptidoglycan-binding protein [Candidatus Paceibacterota bacterium]MCF7863145.1 peptidoglycan-binding protein [Candidatus Paceibacterota bacterium]
PNLTNTPNILPSNTVPFKTTTPVLSQNKRSEDVRQLQQALNTLGYTVSISGAGSLGNETTYFGPATKNALIKFQKANNLTPDGIFGPKSRGVLNALLSNIRF